MHIEVSTSFVIVVNLGQAIKYREKKFSWFFSISPAKFWVIASTKKNNFFPRSQSTFHMLLNPIFFRHIQGQKYSGTRSKRTYRYQIRRKRFYFSTKYSPLAATKFLPLAKSCTCQLSKASEGILSN